MNTVDCHCTVCRYGCICWMPASSMSYHLVLQRTSYGGGSKTGSSASYPCGHGTPFGGPHFLSGHLWRVRSWCSSLELHEAGDTLRSLQENTCLVLIVHFVKCVRCFKDDWRLISHVIYFDLMSPNNNWEQKIIKLSWNVRFYV